MRGWVAAVVLVVAVASGCGGDGVADTTTATTVPNGAALAEAGPYGVGKAFLSTVDSRRERRPVRFFVFYPAGTGSVEPVLDAPPAVSGGPYPVVVGDGDIGDVLGSHLASHGFVFVAVQGQHTWGFTFSPDMIDFPLDQAVALDVLENLDGHPLEGLADTGRSGVTGYSFGSWDALMLAGARVDPQHYSDTCAARPAGWSDNWWNYICGNQDAWETVVARAEEVGIATPDGLWASMGDERIRATMPMGPEGFDLTGPDGLASVTVPVLLVAAGEDTANDYDPATTSLFENLPEVELITFVGADHFMITEPDAVLQMRRFALAFFGYHLTGADGYAQYLSQQFVEQVAPGLGDTNSFDTLVWGVAGN